jgi:hypothetical protein
MTKPKGPAEYDKHLRSPLYGKYPTDAPVRGSCGTKGANPKPSSRVRVTGDQLDSPETSKVNQGTPSVSTEGTGDRVSTPRSYSITRVTPSVIRDDASLSSDSLDDNLGDRDDQLYLDDDPSQYLDT